MRLAKLSEFRRMRYAPGSEPSLKTLRARIDRGEIPGGTVEGKRYYVDLDEFERATGMRRNLEECRNQLARDPLLAGLV